MSALLLFVPSVISAVCFGLSNGLSKKIAQLNPSVGLLLRGATILTVFVPLFFIVYYTAPALLPSTLNRLGVLLTLLLGVFGYLPIYFFYRGVAHGYVAIVTPISNTRAALSLALTLAFVGVHVSLTGWIGVCLLLLSALLISLPDRLGTFEDNTLKHSVLYGAIASVLWGITFFLFQFTIPIVGPFLAAVLIELGVTIGALIHIAVQNIRISTQMIKDIGFFYVLFIGITSALASFLFMVGIDTIGFAYATAIGSLAPLVASLIGIVYLKEPWSMRHILAIVIGVVGLALLAFH